jgi:hypothetical protein
VLGELEDHVLVGGIVRGELHRELQHVLAEESHPRRAVGLFEVAAGGQRRAAVEHTDVVEAEEAAIEDVLAETVFAVHPPGEIQQQLAERGPEKVEVGLAVHGVPGAMQEQRCKRVDRRVHVAEIPLVGGYLTVRMQIGAAQHQLHLILGKIRIDDRDRERMEGQVPGRVPRVFPFVGHRDDVPVQHVEPLRIPGSPIARMQGIGVVLVEPVVAVEEEELLAPQHAGDRLAHHTRRIGAHGRGRDRLVELVRFANPVGEDRIERLAERPALLVRKPAGESQADYGGLSGTERGLVVSGDLGAVLVGIHRILPAVHDTVVDTVLDVSALVAGVEQPLMIRFVLGEQQRNVALAGEHERAQEGVRG